MNTAAEQQQILNSIWPNWRTIATSTGTADTPAAERAVRQLYSLYNRPDPFIIWNENTHYLARVFTGRPFFPHIREQLIYSVWDKLHEPERLCARIGYDRQTGTFRLNANKAVVFAQTRLSPTRGGRPIWLSNFGNIIGQFDADALALQALAKPLAMRIDATIQKLATIITALVTECFAAILFEESCILVRKPRILVLNEAQQLSAQEAPAFQGRGSAARTLYVINGRTLSVANAPKISFGNLSVISPARRELMIAYIGWEKFLKLAVEATRAHEVHRDKFGQLYRVACGTQLFTMVRVKNSTPESDGSFHQHVIPVDPQCRPLPDPNNPRQQFGAPQGLTARNAVASTFYMTGEQYGQMIGDQS